MLDARPESYNKVFVTFSYREIYCKLHLELHDLELILTEQHWSPGIQQPH